MLETRAFHLALQDHRQPSASGAIQATCQLECRKLANQMATGYLRGSIANKRVTR